MEEALRAKFPASAEIPYFSAVGSERPLTVVEGEVAIRPGSASVKGIEAPPTFWQRQQL